MSHFLKVKCLPKTFCYATKEARQHLSEEIITYLQQQRCDDFVEKYLQSLKRNRFHGKLYDENVNYIHHVVADVRRRERNAGSSIVSDSCSFSSKSRTCHRASVPYPPPRLRQFTKL